MSVGTVGSGGHIFRLPASPSPHVSRETHARLKIIDDQLKRWQPQINLVAPSTLPTAWERHIEDSLQLANLEPSAQSWVDLGSGGGFPGLVVAAVRMEDPAFRMVLVESNGKKCAFLRETARLARLPVEVRNGRIEDVVPTLGQKVDVVSARALAPLVKLLGLAESLLSAGAIGIFPKGQDVDDEMLAASISWNLIADLIHSRTEVGAAIVRVRSASRK
jgi:16S rRNA (guanine527-N7)-methyltransferase